MLEILTRVFIFTVIPVSIRTRCKTHRCLTANSERMFFFSHLQI